MGLECGWRHAEKRWSWVFEDFEKESVESWIWIGWGFGHWVEELSFSDLYWQFDYERLLRIVSLLVSKNRSQKLINTFVPETKESACFRLYMYCVLHMYTCNIQHHVTRPKTERKNNQLNRKAGNATSMCPNHLETRTLLHTDQLWLIHREKSNFLYSFKNSTRKCETMEKSLAFWHAFNIHEWWFAPSFRCIFLICVPRLVWSRPQPTIEHSHGWYTDHSDIVENSSNQFRSHIHWSLFGQKWNWRHTANITPQMTTQLFKDRSRWQLFRKGLYSIFELQSDIESIYR